MSVLVELLEDVVLLAFDDVKDAEAVLVFVEVSDVALIVGEKLVLSAFEEVEDAEVEVAVLVDAGAEPETSPYHMPRPLVPT